MKTLNRSNRFTNGGIGALMGLAAVLTGCGGGNVETVEPRAQAPQAPLQAQPSGTVADSVDATPAEAPEKPASSGTHWGTPGGQRVR